MVSGKIVSLIIIILTYSFVGYAPNMLTKANTSSEYKGPHYILFGADSDTQYSFIESNFDELRTRLHYIWYEIKTSYLCPNFHLKTHNLLGIVSQYYF